MRHDSHLKMLVSGSSKSAIRPRDRSGRSRFSYGYFRVTGRGRTKCSSVRSIPAMIPFTCPSQSRAARETRSRLIHSLLASESVVAHSPVYVSEHDVDRSQYGHGVRNQPILEKPRKYLQIREGGPAHLRTERVRAAAVADHVDADLALGTLDRVIGLAFGALPDVTEPRAHRTAGQLVETLTQQRDRESHLAKSDAVARVGVSLRVDDRLQRRELRIDRVRAVASQIPVHPRAAEHGPGHAVGLRDIRRDRAHSDRALEEDLVLVEDRDVILFDVLLEPIEEARELRYPSRREV